MGHQGFFWVFSVLVCVSATYSLHTYLRKPALVVAIYRQLSPFMVLRCFVAAALSLVFLAETSHAYPLLRLGWIDWVLVFSPYLQRYASNTETYSLTLSGLTAFNALVFLCALVMMPYTLYSYEEQFRLGQIRDMASVVRSAARHTFLFFALSVGLNMAIVCFVISVNLGLAYRARYRAECDNILDTLGFTTAACDQRALETSTAHSLLIFAPMLITYAVYRAII